MGVSTNGDISFGILFEEGVEFPWDGDEFDGDIFEWWLVKAHGYVPPVQIYGADGNYIDGIEPSAETISAYYAHRGAFIEPHPLPVTLVNYCSGDYPIYILAVPNVGHLARRGYPVAFEPSTLTVEREQVDALIGFCQKYGIEMADTPKWWLSSEWN